MKKHLRKLQLRGEPLAFSPIVRAKKLPVDAAASLGIEKLDGENRLEIRNESDETHLYLSGTVGSSWWDESGITEKEVRDALAVAKKGKTIHVHINSEGGSVKEGLGIYNAIKERAADITCHIDGYALSIASVFPLAAGKVVSPKSAIWMIHNAWSWAQGNAADMEAQAKMLREHDQMLNEIYQEHTGKSETEIRDAMNAETWIRGSLAVDWGLADETGEEKSDDSQARYTALPQAWLDRCKNIPETILAAVRREPNQTQPAPVSTLANNSAAQSAVSSTPPTAPAANSTLSPAQPTPPANTNPTPNPTPKMNEPTPPAAAQPAASTNDAVLALTKKLINQRLNECVKAQKITKAEMPIYLEAALKDEEGTFAILDAKASAIAASEPVAGNVFVTAQPSHADTIVAKAQERYPLLKTTGGAKARFTALRNDWDSMIADALRQDDVRAQAVLRTGALPNNSNTYSSTLVTAFLTDGATTVLTPKLAPFRAFNRDFSADPYKPNAVAQHKFVSGGSTTQTDATNFESGDSVVAPVTITPHQYTTSIQISNSDLNNGLRMENLVTINASKHGTKLLQVAMAPITLANFTETIDGSQNVITAANFGFSSLATLWGRAQKFNMRNLVIDGNYLAKLLNQPTYFQQINADEGAFKAFGWDGIFLCSDFTGASNNAILFACDPQAIAVLAGLPLTPPTGIPGNTLQTGAFKLPGVELSTQTNSWFNLASRTAWMSFDNILGAAKQDGTAGIVGCSS